MAQATTSTALRLPSSNMLEAQFPDRRTTGMIGHIVPRDWVAGSTIRVLVADDYEPLRRFVSSTLENLPELQVVGVVSDGLSALEKALELHADLIVLDVNLPKLNGFEVARRIREHLPQLKIIFISADRSLAKDALQLGANGYVVESDAGKEFVPALEAVLQGKQYVSLSLVRGLHRELT